MQTVSVYIADMKVYPKSKDCLKYVRNVNGKACFQIDVSTHAYKRMFERFEKVYLKRNKLNDKSYMKKSFEMTACDACAWALNKGWVSRESHRIIRNEFVFVFDFTDEKPILVTGFSSKDERKVEEFIDNIEVSSV